MKIHKYWFWEMPEKIPDVVVVIDAYAATTNLCLMLSQKPKKVILVNNINFEKAKINYPDSTVVGESVSLSADVFKVTNLPVDIAKANLSEKQILYMSINGTRVLESIFKKTKIILICCFTNMAAVVKYLYRQRVKEIVIIMSGDWPDKVYEDKICADVLINEFTGKSYNWKEYSKEVTEFINSYYGYPNKRKKSLPYVLDLNAYNIVPRVFKNKQGFLEIRPS